MQKTEYPRHCAPVNTGSTQTVACRVPRPGGGYMPLSGTWKEVMAHISARCPGGKLRELWGKEKEAHA